ncbi:MAG: lipoprotein [Burkholderiales bacterium]|nr:lipoprotein [Burkholderiales bacterium]
MLRDPCDTPRVSRSARVAVAAVALAALVAGCGIKGPLRLPDAAPAAPPAANPGDRADPAKPK